MVNLHGRTTNNITLLEALKNCANALAKNSHAVALLYSPDWCKFGYLQFDGNLVDSKGTSFDLSSVFEAKVFNDKAELRWLNELNGVGKAVLISEADISSCLTDNINILTAIDTNEQCYLLWGEKVRSLSTPGWTRLAAARIGAIDVPVSSQTDEARIYLQTLEYLGEDEYGNVAVVEERLIRLIEKRVIKSEVK
ncbi:hypothetical protein Cri9333_0582 [Crinalium epipsammum PCC 9333]|uniref:Uncharacterized protein n=1 Tax=Crinalium epipsammum PCC 9333 TaxID=1173022 RepID=K9VTY3_9CYAN|nr:CRISPR-associated protein Csx19 [Crinalium epipsammum]AFZ11528.1 hypothetical protein Cri9333_0582 [Crinalium epipsammum PCC 9333]